MDTVADQKRNPTEERFFRSMMDAMPTVVLVVDDDVRIIEANQAALGLLGGEASKALHRRGGEVLHCIRALETPEGCGRAPACADCVVRNSVKEACRHRQVVRAKTRLELRSPGEERPREVFMLVSASPFRFQGKDFVLLALEDITELIQLRRIIPICSFCKKIRDDAGFWQQVEEYMGSHLDVCFTHGICEACLGKHYPDL